jgi:hypothetical protein
MNYIIILQIRRSLNYLYIVVQDPSDEGHTLSINISTNF